MTLTVKLPDAPDKTAFTVDEDEGKITFVTIDHDPYLGNPCEEADGVGMIYSASRKHINHKPYDELIDILKSDEDAIPLSYFEHGQCLWMVQNSAASQTPGVEFQWDGVRFAGVWVPDVCVRESYTGQDGLTRKQWMFEQAESACATYTEWANGQCFGYSITTYLVRKTVDGELFDALSDYRHDKAISEDSCAGFYGWESVVEAVKESLS